MPTFPKIVLTLIATVFFLGEIKAQPKAVGGTFSLSGIGLSFEQPIDEDRFMDFSLKADLWEVFSDRREIPGLSAHFTWNLILKSWTSAEGNTIGISAGAGVATGYTYDYKKAAGVLLGLKGKIGIECSYMRKVKLSLGFSPVLGTHIRKEDSTLHMDYYLSGIFNTIMPEVGVKYLF